MLTSNGCIKHSELDDFREGCDPGTSRSEFLDISIKGETLKDIKHALNDHFECTDDCMIVDPCDDSKNRIDVQFLERKSGIIADQTNINNWKKGTTRLWLVIYSFHFSLVTDTINLEEY